MNIIRELEDKILSGSLIEKNEAMGLINCDIDELSAAANRIRMHFCGDGFDICTVKNGKSGRCSEDCKYCGQAACYDTPMDCYDLISADAMLEGAIENENGGAQRYSIVTSGKRLSPGDLELACQRISYVKKHSNIEICASFGLLGEEDFKKLKAAGVSRVHNNLETSRRYFPEICSTHTYDEKIETIKAALKVGMEVCSGGILGIGETMEDRIDMELTLREIGIDSVPLNILNPIPGTPFADKEPLSKEEIQRSIAICRFILPGASIRIASGRRHLDDTGRSCFLAGANATISGRMISGKGFDIPEDIQMLAEIGYTPRLWQGALHRP